MNDLEKRYYEGLDLISHMQYGKKFDKQCVELVILLNAEVTEYVKNDDSYKQFRLRTESYNVKLISLAEELKLLKRWLKESENNEK